MLRLDTQDYCLRDPFLVLPCLAVGLPPDEENVEQGLNMRL